MRAARPFPGAGVPGAQRPRARGCSPPRHGESGPFPGQEVGTGARGSQRRLPSCSLGPGATRKHGTACGGGARRGQHCERLQGTAVRGRRPVTHDRRDCGSRGPAPSWPMWPRTHAARTQIKLLGAAHPPRPPLKYAPLLRWLSAGRPGRPGPRGVPARVNGHPAPPAAPRPPSHLRRPVVCGSDQQEAPARARRAELRRRPRGFQQEKAFTSCRRRRGRPAPDAPTCLRVSSGYSVSACAPD